MVVNQNEIDTVIADGKTKNKQTTGPIKTVTKRKGQTHGQHVKKQPSEHHIPSGVDDRESNTIDDITIDTMPYEFKDTDIDTMPYEFEDTDIDTMPYEFKDTDIDTMPYEFKDTNIDSPYLTGLLAYLLRGRNMQRSSSAVQSEPACQPEDIYVNYIYEYDIRNQVLNASLQDPNSAVVQRLQSDIADWAAEEIYKRNLVSYVTDDVRLTKIIDVSKEYDNRATLRFYVSINVSKNLIPVIRRVLELVFEKLQKERFATSTTEIDWGNVVLIPITK